MHLRSSPAAAALAVGAALLLTACGGGSDSNAKDSNKIAGVDESSKKAAPPTASPSAGVAGGPKITLAADYSDTFTPEKVGDPVKDAILNDNAQFVRAQDAAIIAGNPKFPALQFYTEGEAAATSEEWVKSFKTNGRTLTGTVRYYKRVVSVQSKTTAAISYCGDESKGYTKIIKTGKVEKTPPSDNSYVAYGATVQKNSAGVWELTKITSARGAASCR